MPTGAAAGVGVGVAAPVCTFPAFITECGPLRAGSERINAISMNVAAAPIVIFARMLCVPRGPNAVLETLLVNNAPASALPGWSNTATTNTKQDAMKMPNNM
jgi:hypothetical protein